MVEVRPAGCGGFEGGVAGVHAGLVNREDLWPMPLPAAYRKGLETEVADIAHKAGPAGGMLTAGLFLLFLMLALQTWVAQIPMAALVAVMIMVSIGAFDWSSVHVRDVAEGARPGLDLPAAQAFVAALDVPVGPKEGWTDVARFSELGIPALNFGPGDPMYAHKDDECCRLASLDETLAALVTWLDQDDVIKLAGEGGRP